MSSTANALGLSQVMTIAMLSPEMREKFETSKSAGKNHPLYVTEQAKYGQIPRGVIVKLQKPIAAKAGDFSCHFLPNKERNTLLNTSRVKSKYMKELDP
jgi:hypothetical protein